MCNLKKQWLIMVVIIGMQIIANFSCGKSPSGILTEATGNLELQVQLAGGVGKITEGKRTAFDSLIVEVSGNDIATLRCASAINPQQLFLIDTISGIPSGSERRVRVMTINRAGNIIHEDSAGIRTIRVEPNITTVLQVVLVPVRGSIYLQIGGVPTTVDSIGVRFTADDGTQWKSAVARSPKVYISIDGIPHNTHGVLLVAGYTAGGDTLYQAKSEIRVNARSTNSVQLSFKTMQGGVALTGTLQLPGATVVSGSMGAVEAAATERGDLVITEIMYAANDSEYIEIYNPQDVRRNIDSLYLDIDGAKRLFTDISIGAKQFFVIGRQALPWVDTFHPVKSGLDLSGNGNWITILSKEGVVIDQVIFTGGSNDLEWPRVSGKTAICLRAGNCSAIDNNFGRNWASASKPINAAPAQMGTPHEI